MKDIIQPLAREGMAEPAHRAEEEAERPDSVTEDVSDDEENLITDPPEFFDENADMSNEDWARKQRGGRTSDAILSCPACFTSLCVDCQRHDTYITQFRAMFVSNCKTIENEILRMPPPRKSVEPKKRKKQGKPVEQDDQEGAHPVGQEEVPNIDLPLGESFKSVCCSECGTQVAVIDSDEVYHFFNTLPTYS